MYTVWRRCIRRLWDIPYRTRSKYIATLQKDNPIDIQLLCRCIKFMKCNGSSNNSLVIICNNLQKHDDTPKGCKLQKIINMISNGDEDKIDNGTMCDTYKVNTLRTCIAPVDVVVNVKLIILKNLVWWKMVFWTVNYRNLKLMNYCKIYVVNSLVFYYM